VSPGPTLIVVEGKALRARLDKPKNAKDIGALLEPWLR
jgi:hypothetical protein